MADDLTTSPPVDATPYSDALWAAIGVFRTQPTPENLQRVYDAANDYQFHVDLLDDQTKATIEQLAAQVGAPASGGGVVSAAGLRIGSVTIPWLGVAVVAGLALYVGSSRRRR